MHVIINTGAIYRRIVLILLAREKYTPLKSKYQNLGCHYLLLNHWSVLFNYGYTRLYGSLIFLLPHLYVKTCCTSVSSIPDSKNIQESVFSSNCLTFVIYKQSSLLTHVVRWSRFMVLAMECNYSSIAPKHPIIPELALALYRLSFIIMWHKLWAWSTFAYTWWHNFTYASHGHWLRMDGTLQ
jgi:hypothetical protein